MVRVPRTVGSVLLFGLASACYVSGDIFPPTTGDETVATCPMPSLELLYPHATPPAPLTKWPVAPWCARGKHDVLIILGYPSNDDGSPSSMQRARIDTALRLYDEGYGDRFIVTGGAVHNAHVEAEAMAALLRDKGIAEAAIFEEPRAEHTDENLYFSTRIMLEHGWETALVVSNDLHLAYVAACDANCCVRLGRFSTLAFPVHGSDDPIAAGHYVLVPPANEVTVEECRHLRNPTKAMCVNFTERLACAGRLEITP
ncbi:MAG: YdcF family protein [Myxococcota bacterium]